MICSVVSLSLSGVLRLCGVCSASPGIAERQAAMHTHFKYTLPTTVGRGQDRGCGRQSEEESKGKRSERRNSREGAKQGTMSLDRGTKEVNGRVKFR